MTNIISDFYDSVMTTAAIFYPEGRRKDKSTIRLVIQRVADSEKKKKVLWNLKSFEFVAGRFQPYTDPVLAPTWVNDLVEIIYSKEFDSCDTIPRNRYGERSRIFFG